MNARDTGHRDCTKIRVGMKGFSNRIEDLLNRPALLLDLTMLFERLLATYALTTPVFSSSAKSLIVKSCKVSDRTKFVTFDK